MDTSEHDGNVSLPSNVTSTTVPTERPGFGSRGSAVSIVTNLIGVTVETDTSSLFRYEVAIYNKDGDSVDDTIRHEIIDNLFMKDEFSRLKYAFNGKMSLCTTGWVPDNENGYKVVLHRDHFNSLKRGREEKYKVEVRFADKIPMDIHDPESVSSSLHKLLRNHTAGQRFVHFRRTQMGLSLIPVEPMIQSCGVSIRGCSVVEGRILPPPELKVGNGCRVSVHNGRWNFKDKTFADPCEIKHWAVVDFSSGCDVGWLISELLKVAERKGVVVESPSYFTKDNSRATGATAVLWVEEMFKEVMSAFKHSKPNFILCLLSNSNSEIHVEWKNTVLPREIPTQSLVPSKIVNDKNLSDVLMGINVKLGGLNFELAHELAVVSKVPTIIIGMSVSHMCGQNIEAVVSSRQWPSICHYKPTVRTQSAGGDIMHCLYKSTKTGKSKRKYGIMREVLVDFAESSGGINPEQIIIFRDFLSESAMINVLNFELGQIKKACKYYKKDWNPKVVIITAQRDRHVRFLGIVPPGSVIDKQICHPSDYDFYLFAHSGGRKDKSRPVHYRVFVDEVGFSADAMEELVHSLSYVYQFSCSPLAVVAPLHLARKEARLMRQRLKR